jgi:hypothetical protein
LDRKTADSALQVKTFDDTCGIVPGINSATQFEKGRSHANADYDRSRPDEARQDRRLGFWSSPGHRAAGTDVRDYVVVFAMRSDPRRKRPTESAAPDDDISRRERLLDEALTNTFPASDPLSIATP